MSSKVTQLDFYEDDLDIIEDLDADDTLSLESIPDKLKAQCLKIAQKVAFNMASEASYIYILSGQKLFKNAKNSQFWRVFENLKLAVKQYYQIGQFNRTKNGENAKIEKCKFAI